MSGEGPGPRPTVRPYTTQDVPSPRCGPSSTLGSHATTRTGTRTSTARDRRKGVTDKGVSSQGLGAGTRTTRTSVETEDPSLSGVIYLLVESVTH